TPNRLPTSRLPRTSARFAVRCTSTAESMAGRSIPEPVISSPSMRTSSAVIVTTLPVPGPTSCAPGLPTSATGRPITRGPAWRPRTRRNRSPAAAASMRGWIGSPAAMRSSAAPAGAVPTRRRTAPARAAMATRTGLATSMSSSPRLDDHAALHLHVQRMAEPLAVVPVDAGSVGLEGDRGGCLRAHFHGDAVVHDREAVGEVLDHVAVADEYRDLVALFDGEV